jgi:hypothetical protein
MPSFVCETGKPDLEKKTPKRKVFRSAMHLSSSTGTQRKDDTIATDQQSTVAKESSSNLIESGGFYSSKKQQLCKSCFESVQTNRK